MNIEYLLLLSFYTSFEIPFFHREIFCCEIFVKRPKKVEKKKRIWLVKACKYKWSKFFCIFRPALAYFI